MLPLGGEECRVQELNIKRIYKQRDKPLPTNVPISSICYVYKQFGVYFSAVLLQPLLVLLCLRTKKTSEDLAEFFWEQLFLGHSSNLDQRWRMWICPSSAQVSGWIFTPSSSRAGAAWSAHQKNDLLKKTQLRFQWMSYCMLTGKTVWCVEWCFSNLSITKTVLTQFALKINLSIEK